VELLWPSNPSGRDVQRGSNAPPGASSSGTAAVVAPTAVLEPILVEILDRDPEELRITWVEIRALPELNLVTAIEVLSPINKSCQGRQAYLDKRDKRHASQVREGSK
jgi:Protein of unknown function (DUF4058)